MIDPPPRRDDPVGVAPEPGRLVVVGLLVALTLVEGLRLVAASGSWADFVSDDPSWAFDYPLAAYLVEIGARTWGEVGSLWGYEPHFMAGYPHVFLEHNLVGLQLASILLPATAPGLLVRIVGTAMMMSIPSLVYGSARAIGARRDGALGAALVGVGLSATGELVVFVASTPVLSGWAPLLVLPALAAAYRFLTSGCRPSGAVLLVLPALALLIHKGAVVFLPVPLVVMLAIFARPPAVARAAGVYGASAAIALAVNWVWIGPLARHLHVRTDLPPPMWRSFDPWRIVTEIVTPVAGWDGFEPAELIGAPLLAGAVVRSAVVFLGVGGLVLAAREGRGRLVVALVFCLVFLAGVSYLGSWIEWIARTEPYRYVIAMRALWLLPAALTLGWAFARLAPAGRAAVWLVCAGLWAAPWVGASFARFLPRGQLSSERPAAVAALGAWIEERAPERGRLMIEDAWAAFDREGPFGGSYPMGVLAFETDRELIGGRVPYFRVPHRFASFYEATAFGEPIYGQSAERLRTYLVLYDVTAIAAWHPESRARLDDLAREPGEPSVRRMQDVDRFAIYRVERQANPMHVGSGRVEARWGALAVSEVVPSAGEVVLRYHWMDGLVGEPQVRLAPVRLEDDPVPFIRVIDPPERFRLRAR